MRALFEKTKSAHQKPTISGKRAYFEKQMCPAVGCKAHSDLRRAENETRTRDPDLGKKHCLPITYSATKSATKPTRRKFKQKQAKPPRLLPSVVENSVTTF